MRKRRQDDDPVLMFWTIAVLLTLAVTASVVWPLVRRRPGYTPARAEHDLEVYAAQLAELDGDIARGLIAKEDAAVARAEIGRRVLRAAHQAEAARADASGSGRGLVATGLAVALALPLAGIVFYMQVGAPDRPDLPLAARSGETPGGAQMAEIVAAAEARLAANPEDGQGWDVMAPIYLRIGESAKAVEAYRNAIDLLGETPARLLGYGEALTRDARGEVTDEARAVFERASDADPNLIAPRIFLALDLSQEGRFGEAQEAWAAVLNDSPPDAPWRPMAETALRDAEAQGRAGAVNELARASAGMSEAERSEMIAGMVAGLAERLEAEPDDAEGWARLIEAYGVLGDEPAARQAVADARAAFPDDTAEWQRIAASARSAGLDEDERTEARP